MDEVLPDSQSLSQTMGMDFAWGSNTYAAPYGMSEPANAELSTPIGMGDENSRYAQRKPS